MSEDLDDLARALRSLKIPQYFADEYKSRQRADDVAWTKREAAECDCWTRAEPLCARCKLKQVSRPVPAPPEP